MNRKLRPCKNLTLNDITEYREVLWVLVDAFVYSRRVCGF